MTPYKINKVLSALDDGPRLRLSRSGKTLYSLWIDHDGEIATRIPVNGRAEIHALLAAPERVINKYCTTAAERALYILGLR